MNILLVEDDRSIATSLVEGLTGQGFVVTLANSGVAALNAEGYDLVLLDLGLPDMDGREVFRLLRAKHSIPIIMLTARAEEFDRVLGLELGADDYVTKPFSLRELAARIRAVLRRTGDGPSTPEPDVQRVDRLSIDRRTRRVFLDNQELQFTAKEFDLLSFLASDIGAVHTRTDILENVWDEHWFGPTKTVDAHISSIRRKLGDHEWIQAVRGVGFRLEPPA